MNDTKLKEKRLINYIKSLGIEINTSTKARGHQGFFLKNRIDISTNLPDDRIIQTIMHEFAHYVHSQIENDINKSGGTIAAIFNTNENIDVITEELENVTSLVDTNSDLSKYNNAKNEIMSEIKRLDNIIKKRYPKFQRSKPFKEFNKYIKGSKARYFLKHDNIKLVSGFIFQKIEYLSIENIEEDFPEMSREFVAYIKLKSYQRKLAKYSSKMNKLNKYYAKPTELFARFIEGLYSKPLEVKETAPYTYKRFIDLLQNNYYPNLKEIFAIVL